MSVFIPKQKSIYYYYVIVKRNLKFQIAWIRAETLKLQSNIKTKWNANQYVPLGLFINKQPFRS